VFVENLGEPCGVLAMNFSHLRMIAFKEAAVCGEAGAHALVFGAHL
jgi:hypothetical protein